MARTQRRPVLYGRQLELDVLGAALQRAVTGRLAVVLMEGEPGIGKTRLLAETVRSVDPQAWVVATGRAEELERTRPFGVMTQALGCTASAVDPRRVTVAALLSGAGQAAPVTVSSDPGLQFRAVDALSDLVEELALDSPVLLILDDLQWADPSSLLTLGTMLRRLANQPVAILGGFRPLPRPAGLQVLLESMRGEEVRRLTLARLDGTAVRSLATESIGGDPGPDLLAGLARAGGNPLYIKELLDSITQPDTTRPGKDVEPTAPRTVPTTLRLTILNRLNLLPPDSVQVLRSAVILGTSFSLTELSAITGRPAIELSQALDPTLVGGVLEDDGPRLRFGHDLVWEAIYQELPAGVRVGLHREAGRRLAALGVPALRVAEQLARGAELGDKDAVSWLSRAAREAAPTSPEVGAELLERATALLPASDPDRDPLSLERAQALVLAGRITDAEVVCRELLAHEHDPALDGPVGTCLGHALLTNGRPAEALPILDRAGACLPTSERATAIAWGSLARTWVGDLEGASSAAARAHRLAADAADLFSLAIADGTRELVAAYRGRLEEALRISDASLRDADAGPDRGAHRYPFYATRALSLIEVGRLDQARTALETGQRICEELGARWSLVTYQAYSALERFAAGDWDRATTEFEASVELAKMAGDTFSLTLSHSSLALINLHRGDLVAAERALDVSAAGAAGGARHFAHRAAWVRALVAESRGDPTTAYESLRQTWRDCVESGIAIDLPVLGPDLTRLSRAADPRKAHDVAAAVARVAEQNRSSSLTAAALRCRGLADDDPDLLCRAAETYADGELPLELALTSHDAADALVRHGRSEQARGLVDRAVRIYQDLGASRDLARLDVLLRELGVHRGRRGPRPRERSGWASLTPTEHTIALLVAEGLSNPQIGQRLFISRRTAQTHVAHIFTKLDIGSRAALAAEVARHEPTSEA